MAKVLVVDDDLELAETLNELLEREKHEPDLAHTGNEGWEKAQANQYDLLILDWDLPDLNGINILNRFRKAGFETPVIMLTGHSSVADKELGLDTGADDYITKPFALGELLARIRAALRRGESKKTVHKSLGKGNEELLKAANLQGTQVASRYEIQEKLGEGGSGIVFKALHPLMEKLVAIKVLNIDLKDPKQSTERFTREAKAISRLDHPNIINILDFGLTENNNAFMVMEYIAGWNLADVIKAEGALLLSMALDLAIQICDGVGHAHSAGILHRDLKPANILLKKYEDRPLQVKILDFGLAKIKGQDANDSPALTKEGQIFGTPMYMSPEQVKGKPLDERSDIYSVGSIIYELFTGCPTHFADSSMDMMIKQVSEEPKALKELRPDLHLPDECEMLIRRALHKEPNSRYQSMRDMSRDLANIKQSNHDGE